MGGSAISIPNRLNVVSTSSMHSELFEWRVNGYSLLPRTVGSVVTSAQFDLCGHKWQLLLYPGGNAVSCAGYVSLFLKICEPGPVLATCVLHMVGTKVDEVMTKQFSDATSSWGYVKYILQETVLDINNGIIKDDVVIIKAIVTVATALVNTEQNKYQSLQLGFGSMLNDDSNIKDVILRFDGTDETVGAHRCVLCAMSRVFRDMLQSEVSVSLSREVQLTDVQPSIMKELLFYMYTAAFSKEDVLHSGITKELFVAASKYEVTDAIKEIETALAASITGQNLHEMKQLADSCNCDALKKHCVEFAAGNCPEILMELPFPQF
jgi:hypothetical protein